MDYQIPTIDGRYIKLHYDEASRETMLTLPEDDDGQPSAGLTLEAAEQLADVLGEFYTRSTGEPPPSGR